MIKIANAQFWVHDQDEALAFYTRTLGWEVRSDVTMDEWNFRWLVVGPVGQDDIGLVLMPVPTPPMLDADTSAQLAELVAKGAGGTLFLETDDCQAAYDELSARGVVFNDPPTAAALRHRHVVPRPVGQQHPPHPGARVLHGPRLTSGAREADPARSRRLTGLLRDRDNEIATSSRTAPSPSMTSDSLVHSASGVSGPASHARRNRSMPQSIDSVLRSTSPSV